MSFFSPLISNLRRINTHETSMGSHTESKTVYHVFDMSLISSVDANCGSHLRLISQQLFIIDSQSPVRGPPLLNSNNSVSEKNISV